MVKFLHRKMKIEPVTRDQFEALCRAVGPQGFLLDLQRVDITVGRGIGKGTERFLWTHEGYRITVRDHRGQMQIKRSQYPDPAYFKMKGNA